MKKILIFSLAYYPKHVGGAEVAIKEITDRISPEDIEFHMITNWFDSTLPKEEKIGNVFVHRIGLKKENPQMADLRKFPLHLNKFLYQFFAPLYAYKLNKKYKFDGMWGMMAHSTAVPLAISKFLMPKMPYVLTLQEGDPISHIMKKAKPVLPLFKRGFKKATVIQPISTFLGKWARDMGFEGDIELVPNAVNTKHFSQDFPKKELDKLKEKLGKKENEKYVITTSRLVKKNAVDDVIKALPMLPENIKFIVLGTGPDEKMLKELAKEKKVQDRVMFLGQVDHSEMPKYLKISDVFIRPSLSEGFGNSFVEAMAADLPVIATQEGGISDFLFDPDRNKDKEPTGLAVDPKSPEQIAKQIKRFLENKELTEKIKENAKKMAIEKYDWNLIAKNMREKVFAKLF